MSNTLDRFDELVRTGMGRDNAMAAILRASRDAALDEAAQIADKSREDGRCIAFSIRALRQAPAAAPAADCVDHWHCDPAQAAHACKADRSAPCPTCKAAPAAPAAEPCPEPPPGLVETLEKVHGMGCGNIATHRIPTPAQRAEARIPEMWIEATRDAIADFLTSASIEEKYWKHASAFEEVADQLRKMNVTADAQAKLAARTSPRGAGEGA